MKVQVQKLSKTLLKPSVIISLFIGIALGYSIKSLIEINTNTTKKLPTISVLIHTGNETRNWNGVSLNEGESVLDIIERIGRIENFNIRTTGEGKDRQVDSIFEGEENNGEWKYYINNANPLPTIGRYFPKDGDNILVIYVQK